MNISKDELTNLLRPYKILFGLPDKTSLNELLVVWENVLSTYDKVDIEKASVLLLKKIKRFPFPSDIIDVITPNARAKGRGRTKPGGNRPKRDPASP